MLARAAASMLWTSRYNERAENIARMLEVAYRMSMIPQAGAANAEDWRSTLISAGCLGGYINKYGDNVIERHALHYMLFDEGNQSSVRSCLEQARNNARSVRTAITSEMWESINTTWVDFTETKPATITSDRLLQFLTWVKQRSIQFRGATLGTIMRNDAFYFSQIGAFMERADNTARILDVKYWLLLPHDEAVGGELDRNQWSTILRSVSAQRSYRFAYRDAAMRAINVAEFLILRPEMPRSLAYCYDWIEDSFADLVQRYGEETESYRLVRALSEELKSAKIADIFTFGLHEFLSAFLARNNGVYAQIAKDYHFA